jgi:hypothetical protein
LTEPIGGYETMATPGATWTAMGTPDEPDGGQYVPAYGTPLDANRPDGNWGNNLINDGTYANQRLLVLQRLANPRAPWNINTNPYISIDTSSVDVTAFNGLDSTADPNNTPRTISFSAFERGGSQYFTAPAPAPATRALWRPQMAHAQTDVQASPTETGNPHVFRRELISTLGYLNQGYGQPYTYASMPATTYVGAPQVNSLPQTSAFPWLVFNNRPFMSPAELLHVPVTSQYQLLVQFNTITGPPGNVYANNVEQDQVFAHLPNFLRTNATQGTITGTDGPLLARLLDYVETPSRFVMTERFYNPQQFSSTPPGTAGNNVASGYRPPFNYLSRFRDPGRINLNTFSDELIWSALVGEYTPNNTTQHSVLQGWSQVSDISLARQGYGGTPGQINNGYPSIFSNPFRATEAADLMPNAGVDLRKREAEAGLLRPRMGGTDPLLASSVNTFIVPGSNQQFADPSRSPFFRYLPLQKLANNVTTNSNCFGVWITIGYFEVEDAPNVNSAQDPRRYPDGYMLGQELGLDVGDTQRHRAFYLIDRSIPVGFIPGVKLNSENTVLLKRQIE